MNKRKFLIVTVLIAIIGILWKKYSIALKPPLKKSFPHNIAVKKISKIACFISGEVVNPGVYYLAEASIVSDLINKAGGLTKNADTEQLQAGDFLEDREIINVPKKSFFKKMGFGKAPEKSYFMPEMEIEEEK